MFLEFRYTVRARAGVVGRRRRSPPRGQEGNDHGTPRPGDRRHRGLRPLPLHARHGPPTDIKTRSPARPTESRLGGGRRVGATGPHLQLYKPGACSEHPRRQRHRCPPLRMPSRAAQTSHTSSPTPRGLWPTTNRRPSNADGAECSSKVIPRCTHPPDRTGGCARHVEPSCSAAPPPRQRRPPPTGRRRPEIRPAHRPRRDCRCDPVTSDLV